MAPTQDVEMAGPSTRENLKRSKEVDPDTMAEIHEAKRPKIELDTDKKSKCLTALAKGYKRILEVFLPPVVSKNSEGVLVEDTSLFSAAYYCLNVNIQITNIIFTLHTIKRQRALGRTDTNVIQKSATTDFTVTFRGVNYPQPRDMLLKVWETLTGELGLIYKQYQPKDTDNWYGVFGPFINFFCGFGLRLKELRIGHNMMPITKREGVVEEFNVKKYGLTGAHHILLEGSTFPPEKKSSMAQSVGPMTAIICMLRSEGIYRKKWADAVKRDLNHIPLIDDIIEVTKNQKKAGDISGVVYLLAEILLITTARQATRVFLPIGMLTSVYYETAQAKRGEFLKFFNTTGSGAFYTYKKACKKGWTLTGGMTEEMAGQMVFHSIFGTYKEDLSVLAQITDTAVWKTREEMGTSFRKGQYKENLVKAKLPYFKYYAKMSCANQTGLLSGVYTQVSAIPAFSGTRRHIYTEDFFEHLERRSMAGVTGKTVPQITAALTTILAELQAKLRASKGVQNMGTTAWRDFAGLDLGTPGEPVDLVVETRGHYFMGKPKSNV